MAKAHETIPRIGLCRKPNLLAEVKSPVRKTPLSSELVVCCASFYVLFIQTLQVSGPMSLFASGRPASFNVSLIWPW